MIPVYNFEYFVQKLDEFETNLTETTIGILFVNFRNSNDARIQALQGFLSEYNNLSGKDINFYIPGLSQEHQYSFFCTDSYNEFRNQFQSKFNIKLKQSTPTLLLMEYGRDQVKQRHIQINILNENFTLEKTDRLFRDIFDIAGHYVEILDFSRELEIKHLKEHSMAMAEYVLEKQWYKLIFNPLLGIFKYHVSE